ncbi:MAG TPA: glutamate synthase large subunit, partial [Bryobacteraceae bacterium]|nr:glutamate synthase large subunit [Bryobacteraceae bacterium]
LLRFGFAKDDYKDVVGAMASGQGEPVSSMGDDASLAFLERRVPIAHYLRQRFAQVTNPPIDPLREGLVFDMRAFVGSGPTNGDVPALGSVVMVSHAVLDEHTFDSLRFDHRLEQHPIALSLGDESLETRLRQICEEAVNAVREGATFIVLDNRGAEIPVPAVLAAGAVHQRLTKEGLRMQASIAAADGFARDSHSIATVIAAGANVVTPWLALRIAHKEGTQKAFLSAVRSGLLKIMSKLGICSLRSYTGAQTFESIGLGRDIIEMCFPGMKAHVPTVTFAQFEEDLRAWAQEAKTPGPLPERGYFRFRRDGVRHAFDPNVIKNLRATAMRGDYEAFEKLSDEMERRPPITLRDLIEPIPVGPPVPLEEVEPVSAIVKRFTTAAMSLGALAPEVHKTIAIATNRIGAKSNSGEGGEERSRYARTPDSGRSAIKQVASARFGVSAEYLASADEIEIKMAQGSKPGEGGQIPGHKVSVEIAALRGAVPGQALISPPPHHDIYSIEDLAQLIYDLKNANPRARISVKLVAEVGVGTVAAGVSKAHADVVLISGDSGGTGASPLSSIKHAGIPWELGLAETQQVLVLNDLRGRIRVQTDGKLQTGRDVTIAALLGAEEFGFATTPLVAMGCIMMRKCHLNTCPVGIATQDPALRAKFAGQPEHVVNFFFFIAEQVRQYMAQMGFRRFDEMVGRVDMLDAREAVDHWKARGLDFSAILFNPQMPARIARRCVQPQDHGLNQALDYKLIEHAQEAIDNGAPIEIKLPIRNVHRTVGAMLSGEIARRYGSAGLPDDTIRCYFTGSAGQSFGAFLAKGVTLTLEGDANDYVGKGLSGGRLIVYPPRQSTFLPEENILIGNVVLYGATSGEAFFNGMAGERFAVRNSGATAVVEGLGDHGCEYMTKGLVVVLGKTGRNFAAGMSGGIAYVLDEKGDFAEKRCNTAGVDLEPASDAQDAQWLRRLIERHVEATGSPRGQWILENWADMLPRFIKVFPHEYKRVLGVPRAKQVYMPLAAAAGNPGEQVLHG